MLDVTLNSTAPAQSATSIARPHPGNGRQDQKLLASMASDLLGSFAERKLEFLSEHALLANARQRFYWDELFKRDSNLAYAWIQEQSRALASSVDLLKTSLPKNSLIVDLCCGPTIVLEVFFRTYLSENIKAWVGVDLLSNFNNPPELKLKTTSVPGYRIHADAIRFLKQMEPGQHPISFYISACPYSLTDGISGYEMHTQLDRVMSPGSHLFIRDGELTDYFGQSDSGYEQIAYISSFASAKQAKLVLFRKR